MTPLLADPAALDQTVERAGGLGRQRRRTSCSARRRAASSSARRIAEQVGCGFVPARRPGKLPPETISATYELEYGTNALEVHAGRDRRRARGSLIHDDVLATGGTVKAIAGLVEQLGGEVCGACFIIELDFLNGRERLAELRLPRPDHVLTGAHAAEVLRPAARVQLELCTTPSRAATLRLPSRGETHGHAVLVPPARTAPGRNPSRGVPRRVRLRVRGGAPRPRCARRPRLGAARPAEGMFHNLMTSSSTASPTSWRTSPRGASRRASGRGASTATRRSDLARCSRRPSRCSLRAAPRSGWRCAARLLARLGQPRLIAARRPAVPQRRARRGGRAPFPRRRRARSRSSEKSSTRRASTSAASRSNRRFSSWPDWA